MPDGRRLHLLGFLLSVGCIAAAYASAFPAGAPGWAPWLMAAGIAGALVSMMALGASRDGRVGVLAYPFAFVFVVLAGGFAIALALPAPEAEGLTLWLGLPAGAAVILYGVGLLPLLVIPLAYALTFDHFTLQEEDWERVRALAPQAEERAEEVFGQQVQERADASLRAPPEEPADRSSGRHA